jgi:tRNA(Ile)-lysidine synthase
VTPADLLGRCTFPPPGSVVRCGVSGGADSSALLVLAVAAGCRVTAVHVDHGLRPGSDREADVVAGLADRFGARVEAHTAAVEPGPNLEARARAARAAVLGPDALVGHTADDQAETLLLALLRGSGPAGLAGADPRVRPILGLRRAETHELCRSLGIAVVDDPSNTDPSIRRNRVRHELLPLLDDIAGRDVVPVLHRSAAVHGAVAGLLDDLAAELDPTVAAELAAAPEPVAAHAVRRWVRSATGSDHPPDRAAVGRVLAVASGRAVGCELAGGWRVRRSGGRMRLDAPPAEVGRSSTAAPPVGGSRPGGAPVT